MSTTVSYKGNTIVTLNNETKTLTTAGTWVEGNITITDTSSGASVTITDETNSTGVTCVITTGQTPTPTPADILLNTQLIDYSAVLNDTLLDPGTGETVEFNYYSASDFTKIDPLMTFSYAGYGSGYVCFYDSEKAFISSLTISQDTGGNSNETCNGTLTPAKIPSTAQYVRINALNNPNSTTLSLIRTA